MSLQALIARAETLDPHGVAERFILHDEEFEVRINLKVDGTTHIEICAIDNEDRDVLKSFSFPFCMYRLDRAKIVGRCLLVLCIVMRDTDATDDDKRKAFRKVQVVLNEYFPYQQSELQL
jgi:hypothetical protein